MDKLTEGWPVCSNSESLATDESVEVSQDTFRDPTGTSHEDPLLLEVICERVHCVMYEYAITTAEFVAEDFEGEVLVKPVVRRGNRENAERFMELCRRNGRHLSVPTILIDGDVAFTDVPGPGELRAAVEEGLAKRAGEDGTDE